MNAGLNIIFLYSSFIDNNISCNMHKFKSLST